MQEMLYMQELQDLDSPHPIGEKRGGHGYSSYDGNCSFGCGCWWRGYSSGGPTGLNPFGKCPKNKKTRVIEIYL